MSKHPINPPAMGPSFKAYHPFGMGVEGGSDLIFVSGTTARDEQNQLVGEGDITAQTERVFENIRQVLAAVGSTLDDLVKVTVYLTDLRLFPEVAAVRERIFGDSGPASACVGVSGLVRPGALIEVDAIALARQARGVG